MLMMGGFLLKIIQHILTHKNNIQIISIQLNTLSCCFSLNLILQHYVPPLSLELRRTEKFINKNKKNEINYYLIGILDKIQTK